MDDIIPSSTKKKRCHEEEEEKKMEKKKKEEDGNKFENQDGGAVKTRAQFRMESTLPQFPTKIADPQSPPIFHEDDQNRNARELPIASKSPQTEVIFDELPITLLILVPALTHNNI